MEKSVYYSALVAADNDDLIIADNKGINLALTDILCAKIFFKKSFIFMGSPPVRPVFDGCFPVVVAKISPDPAVLSWIF